MVQSFLDLCSLVSSQLCLIHWQVVIELQILLFHQFAENWKCTGFLFLNEGALLVPLFRKRALAPGTVLWMWSVPVCSPCIWILLPVPAGDYGLEGHGAFRRRAQLKHEGQWGLDSEGHNHRPSAWSRCLLIPQQCGKSHVLHLIAALHAFPITRDWGTVSPFTMSQIKSPPSGYSCQVFCYSDVEGKQHTEPGSSLVNLPMLLTALIDPQPLLCTALAPWAQFHCCTWCHLWFTQLHFAAVPSMSSVGAGVAPC